MENDNILKCSFCDYTTTRNYNLKRHEISKHSKEILNEHTREDDNKLNIHCEIIKDEFICKKCDKKYLTYKSYLKHEENCNSLDILTCPRCMITFSSHQSKCNHMKRNSCKAKSIIHAKKSIITNNIINNIDNSITNNTTNNINNTFIINNYGSERLDYLSTEDMYKILINTNNIPMFIEQKHFNKDFPENHNIMYDDKLKKCKIKENDKWKTINVSLMSTKLLNDNSNSLLAYFNKNKEELNNKIHNEEIYYFILNKLLLIKNRNDKEKYNTLYNLIKFIIENNTFSPQC